jgi:hypothetical protein
VIRFLRIDHRQIDQESAWTYILSNREAGPLYPVCHECFERRNDSPLGLGRAIDAAIFRILKEILESGQT